MKKNTPQFDASILRGPWLLEPHTALSFFPMIANHVMGDASGLTKIEAALIRSVITPTGKEVRADEDIEEGSIGVIRITGPMFKYGNWWYWGADELVAMAQAFENNPNVVGQVWVCDSGGGQVSAVAPYLDFLQNKQKPVVAICDLCASANYWIASATDYVMAENNISASFGSIGVMVELTNWKKYYAKEGLDIHTIVADPSSEKNKAFQLALEGNYDEIRKELLNPLAIKFQNGVKLNRESKLDLNVNGLLNGKMFFTEDAISHGLADGVGNLNDAIKKVTELANTTSAVQTFMNQ